MKTTSYPIRTEPREVCNNCHNEIPKDSFGLPMFLQLPYNNTPVCKKCYLELIQ